MINVIAVIFCINVLNVLSRCPTSTTSSIYSVSPAPSHSPSHSRVDVKLSHV